jgi:hypothetical protein
MGSSVLSSASASSATSARTKSNRAGVRPRFAGVACGLLRDDLAGRWTLKVASVRGCLDTSSTKPISGLAGGYFTDHEDGRATEEEE